MKTNVLFALLAGLYFALPVSVHSDTLTGTAKPDVVSPKEIVTAFSKLAFTERKPVEAALKYISATTYIQHNPQGADGREAFIEGFAQYVISTQYRCEIKRVVAENDLVVVHSHCKEKAEALGAAVMDIFRVQDGLIVEHWDVEQAIPERSANDNTMF